MFHESTHIYSIKELWWTSRLFPRPRNLVINKCNGLNKSHEVDSLHISWHTRPYFLEKHSDWFTFIFPLSLRQNILQKSKYNASLKTTPHNVELSGTPSKKWIHFFTKPLKKYRPILRSAFPFSKASPTTSGTRDLNLLEAKPHEPQATLNTRQLSSIAPDQPLRMHWHLSKWVNHQTKC